MSEEVGKALGLDGPAICNGGGEARRLLERADLCGYDFVWETHQPAAFALDQDLVVYRFGSEVKRRKFRGRIDGTTIYFEEIKVA